MEPCRCPVFFLNMGIFIMWIPFWEFPDRATFLGGLISTCKKFLTKFESACDAGTTIFFKGVRR
jgi:hypothetical protein